MLINEAGMVKAVKNSYKNEGYTVYNHGAVVSIFSVLWYVKCGWGVLPRKVLAAIVEHMGTIPQQDAPLFVEKGEDPQLAFPETIRGEIARWCEGEAEGEAVMMPVTVKGFQLYQETVSGQCNGVDPIHLGIVERALAQKGTAAVASGNRLLWKGDAGGQEAVVLGAVRKNSFVAEEWERAVWKALEGVAPLRRNG